MSIEITLDTKQIEKGIRDLVTRIRDKSIPDALVAGARVVLEDAKKRAPVGFTGNLKKSAFLQLGQVRDQRGRFAGGQGIQFGFNAPYATIMDIGWRKRIIRPVRAKALWIPLTRAAALRGPRKSTSARSLQRRVTGTRSGRGPRVRTQRQNRDFILVPFVRTRRPRAGAKKGPNLYFTTAVRKAARGRTVLRHMAAAITKQLRRTSR